MLHDDSLMRNGDNGHALLKTDEPPWTGAKEFNWQRFFGILRKHFLSSTLFAFLIIGVIAAATLRMKDIYEPRARLEIEPPGLDNFSNQDHGGSLEVDPDYLGTISCSRQDASPGPRPRDCWPGSNKSRTYFITGKNRGRFITAISADHIRGPSEFTGYDH
jgi:hypothetical protein